VMFTSGSTGRPKGVMVGHAGVVNLARWHGTAFGVRPGQRCSQLGAPGFDAAAWEVWGTLGNGGTLVIAPQALKTDPLGLRDWLVDRQIAVSFVPTPLAEALLVLDWPADTGLRTLLTGGDRLHRAPRTGLPFDLVNDYGVTEASVVSTSGVVAAGSGTPSIGAAIDGVDLRVVAPDLTEVADGDAGELVVGGVSVARGYLFDPAATAEVFVIAPDGTGPWYRTRDVVRRRPDGAFDYVGRLDDQVQIRGNRVEPAEIAAVLDQHPEISSCVVVGVQDAAAEPALAVFWQARDTAAVQLTADDLRAYVARRLPAHMVPSIVERVDRMPLTTNGKVDREALLALVGPLGPGTSDTVSDAEADLDESVARIVAQVLKVPAIGPDENFLLKGGHSLLAAQVVARLAERFEVEISLRSLFDNPTPRGMAALVEDELVAQVLALGDDA
jgi:acyl-coenzyme A synthetase/AMP-(fatty) acid ligase/acyl carrier protein